MTTDPSYGRSELLFSHGLFGSRLATRRNGGSACLTEMRAKPRDMKQLPLVAQVINDERIPDDPEDITPEHLPAFRELSLLFDEAGIGTSRSWIEDPSEF